MWLISADLWHFVSNWEPTAVSWLNVSSCFPPLSPDLHLAWSLSLTKVSVEWWSSSDICLLLNSRVSGCACYSLLLDIHQCLAAVSLDKLPAVCANYKKSKTVKLPLPTELDCKDCNLPALLVQSTIKLQFAYCVPNYLILLRCVLNASWLSMRKEYSPSFAEHSFSYECLRERDPWSPQLSRYSLYLHLASVWVGELSSSLGRLRDIHLQRHSRAIEWDCSDKHAVIQFSTRKNNNNKKRNTRHIQMHRCAQKKAAWMPAQLLHWVFTVELWSAQWC